MASRGINNMRKAVKATRAKAAPRPSSPRPKPNLRPRTPSAARVGRRRA